MSRTGTIRVAIVEDHLLQRARTEELMTRTGEFAVVFSGETAPDFVAWLKRAPRNERPHLLLLDLLVDRRPGVEVALVESLLQRGLRILVISALSSPVLVRDVVRAGVSGVVGKRDSEDDILAAVRAVLRGEAWMTPDLAVVMAAEPDRPQLSIQEERALVLYASGLTIEQLAAAMNIGRETAKQYLDRVKQKYARAGIPVHSKLDFGRIAWSAGLIDPSPTVRGGDGTGGSGQAPPD